MRQPAEAAGRPGLFLVLWGGQVVSILGTRLTDFALGVWVFEGTGSVTQYALIGFAATLPGVFLSPLLGAVVDRWDLRKAMILGDLGAGLCTAAIALLSWSGRLEIWHIYVLVAVGSVFEALQYPALAAAIPRLVPRRHLGRASGLNQLGIAGAMIGAPPLAAVLLGSVGLTGVIALDVLTFLVAVGSLLVLRLPERSAAPLPEPDGPRSLWSEAFDGWRHIRDRPALTGLLALFALSNFASAMVGVLFTPLVLSFTDAETLGTVLAAAGVGMLAGGLTMSVTGGPKNRILGVYGGIFAQGVLLLLGGVRPDAVLVASAAFAFLFCVPIVNGSDLAFWQSKVEGRLLGRVLAFRRTAGLLFTPVAYLVAGPLADWLFEPALAPGGALADSVGSVLGVGPGRGIGLMLVLLGISLFLAAAAGVAYRPLRDAERSIPDAPV